MNPAAKCDIMEKPYRLLPDGSRVKLDALQSLTQNMPALQGAQMQKWLQEQLLRLGLDPNALYQELEMTSRFVDTHRDTSDSNAQMQLHSHTFCELIYCINTCGAEYLIGSERYRLQQGDLIILPPGVSHRPLLPERLHAPYMRYVVWLSADFLSLYGTLCPCSFFQSASSAGILRTGEDASEGIGKTFLAGVREAEQKAAGWQAAVMGNTLLLLAQIVRAIEGKNTCPIEAEQPELLDRVTTYVEKNYAHPITLANLAKHFYISSSTISHLFKQKLGVSLYRYVTQRRLIAAKILIEKGCRLEEAAAQTGFSDYSSFYRSFKQEYGISPRQYRQLQENDSQSSHPGDH